MICVKLLPIVGDTKCHLTIGKKYKVGLIPFVEGITASYPWVWVFGDDFNADTRYPAEAFMPLEGWRQKQLNKILCNEFNIY